MKSNAGFWWERKTAITQRKTFQRRAENQQIQPMYGIEDGIKPGQQSSKGRSGYSLAEDQPTDPYLSDIISHSLTLQTGRIHLTKRQEQNVS